MTEFEDPDLKNITLEIGLSSCATAKDSFRISQGKQIRMENKQSFQADVRNQRERLRCRCGRLPGCLRSLISSLCNCVHVITYFLGLSAKDLKKGFFGKPNPYVRMCIVPRFRGLAVIHRYQGQQVKTVAQNSTINPCWKNEVRCLLFENNISCLYCCETLVEF